MPCPLFIIKSRMSENAKKIPHCVFAFSAFSPLFPVPYSLKKIPTHSVYYPTASFKQPASKQTVKNNTQRECVFHNVGTLGSSVRLVVRPNNLDSAASRIPRTSPKTIPQKSTMFQTIQMSEAVRNPNYRKRKPQMKKKQIFLSTHNTPQKTPPNIPIIPNICIS